MRILAICRNLDLAFGRAVKERITGQADCHGRRGSVADPLEPAMESLTLRRRRRSRQVMTSTTVSTMAQFTP
jgi:hypothetical protein